MTTHSITRRTAAAALAALATIAVAAPAAAAPVDKGSWHDTGSEVNDFCGFDVLNTWDFSGHFIGTARGSDGLVRYREHSGGTTVFTVLATGRSYTGVFSTSTKDRDVIDNGDGTLTIRVQASGSEKWYDSTGRLVVKNPGMVQYEILIDNAGTPADPFDDEFLEFLGIVRPSTGRNDVDGRDFCEDLLIFTA